MCVLLFSIGMIAKLLVWDSYVSDKTIDEVKEVYHNENVAQENKFDSLVDINPDICGWITISGTRIDYPVLQGNLDSPDYYLSHNYKNEETKYGSIFIDPNCNLKNSPQNIVIYGHHMADGQMFADLMKFSDVNFYKENPIVKFDTLHEDAKWKIISVFKTNTLSSQGKVFQYVVPKFNTSEKFLEFVDEIKKRSLINIPDDVTKNDILITLSTCSYEFDDFRTVVVARKLRKGESDAIDTSIAEKASNPLMPDCWYERYGGSPPS